MRLDRFAGYAVAAQIGTRGLLKGPRRRQTLDQRLAMLPTQLPTARPVTIHWSDYAIPFIEADSDADLAVGLGVVHAHLRLGQMELLRRIAAGRVAEMVGPLGIRLDATLRGLEIGRAVPAMVAGLSAEVRAWAQGFVDGVNAVQAVTPWPEELELFGVAREPWTLTDLLTSARLAGADISWVVLARLLRAKRGLTETQWRTIWPRLFGEVTPDPQPSLTGSNAAAVAGSRTASGAALFAADPHLSIALPNVWLLCAMRSPGISCAGIMPTGFPLVAIGRNQHLAWGGTSLHAAASDLFDASAADITERRETIRVRSGRPREIVLRSSPLGPIVSDGMVFANPTPLALRWVGHTPSDELGAMLGVMKAATPDAFAAALRDFAIPGQNFLHATVDGHIGHLVATRAPHRAGPPEDVVEPASRIATWDSLLTTPDFADVRDPPRGFVVSANDAPPPSTAVAGYFYSQPDRADRMAALFGGSAKLDRAAMERSQLDVVGDTRAAHTLAARMPAGPVQAVIAAWDGSYDMESAGALAFEALVAELEDRQPDQLGRPLMNGTWFGRALATEDLLALPDATLRPMLDAATPKVDRLLRRYRTWGRVHRMRLRHYLGALPVLGRRFSFGRYRAPGGDDTLHKTGHPPVRGPHAVTYGSSARLVADLAHPNATGAVLLGGQDGWLGSANFIDQVPLWRAGRYLDLPLSPEVARTWARHTVFQPA